jgi:hypothetical protein
LALATWALLCLPLPTAAQAQLGSNTSRDDGDAGNEIPDEIVVRGRRSLHDMRGEVQAARERVYELFNAYNTDDRLDILCSYETRIHSRFKERVCQPRYFLDATSTAGREVARSLQSSCARGPPPCPEAAAAFDDATAIFQSEYSRIPRMKLRLDEEMRRLGRENPEVAAAVEEYQAKEREYHDAAMRRRK